MRAFDKDAVLCLNRFENCFPVSCFVRVVWRNVFDVIRDVSFQLLLRDEIFISFKRFRRKARQHILFMSQ